MPETIGFIGLGLMGKPMAAGRGEDDDSIMAKTVFDIAGVE